MTVSSESSRVVHDGDGVATEFDFDFEVFSTADLRVIKVATDGTETVLAIDAAGGFSASLDGAGPSAGSITYPIDENGTIVSSGESIVVMRNMDYDQSTDITNAGSFRASVIENALDRLTMQVQQLKDFVDRAITAPSNTPDTISYVLPGPVAGAMLGWNGTADGLQNIESDGSNLLEQIDSEHFVIDTFSGTGSQTAFTLTAPPGHQHAVDVYIDGLRQASVDSANAAQYTVSGTTLTFATAPVSGTRNVQVKYRQYTTSTSTTPADTSVTTAKLASSAVTFEKMASGCAVATKTLSAVTLTNTTSTTLIGFTPGMQGSATPRVFSFKLTCTDAGGDAGYSNGNTANITEGFFSDGAIDGLGIKHYGFSVRNVTSSSFTIRTAKNGIALPHKDTGVITQLASGKWTLTVSIVGW